MSLRNKIILGVLTISIAFATGRYTVGQKIVTVEVDKVVTDVQKDKDTKTHSTTIITEKPTGEKTTVTTTDSETIAKSEKHVEDDKSISKTVTTKSGSLNISALAGIDYRIKQPVYGASVTKEILGPITIGLFGITNGTFGASVGINF